ncbi:MAG: SDR family oxidoreductase [Bacteroidota bacterium]|nr:SDR family oxidoreductase [Bacteroidota bacterium]
MFEKNLLKDKVILITGGGTGLGKSMSTKFSELGATVVITSRKLEILKQTATEISEATGRPVVAKQTDVRNYFDNEKVLNEIYEEFGKLDVLINNAAGNFISPTERLSHKAFDTVVNIVLKGTYNFTLAAGKRWIKEKTPGTVLNIVTTYASTGSGYVVPSAISKAGVLNLTRSLAAEWGKYNIRLNSIAPGPFPTKGAWKRLLPDPSMEKELIDRIPLKRVGEHIELANLASYLVSGYSSYINGENITIDGGEWLSGAGQFNWAEKISEKDWDKLAEKVRKNR